MIERVSSSIAPQYCKKSSNPEKLNQNSNITILSTKKNDSFSPSFKGKLRFNFEGKYEPRLNNEVSNLILDIMASPAIKKVVEMTDDVLLNFRYLNYKVDNRPRHNFEILAKKDNRKLKLSYSERENNHDSLPDFLKRILSIQDFFPRQMKHLDNNYHGQLKTIHEDAAQMYLHLFFKPPTMNHTDLDFIEIQKLMKKGMSPEEARTALPKLREKKRLDYAEKKEKLSELFNKDFEKNTHEYEKLTSSDDAFIIEQDNSLSAYHTQINNTYFHGDVNKRFSAIKEAQESVVNKAKAWIDKTLGMFEL